MASSLRIENLSDAAIQLVIGHYYDVPSIQIKKLSSYGFIKRVPIVQKDVSFGGRIGAFEDFVYVFFQLSLQLKICKEDIMQTCHN